MENVRLVITRETNVIPSEILLDLSDRQTDIAVSQGARLAKRGARIEGTPPEVRLPIDTTFVDKNILPLLKPGQIRMINTNIRKSGLVGQYVSTDDPLIGL